jgi:hypothetical protein
MKVANNHRSHQEDCEKSAQQVATATVLRMSDQWKYRD